jgi:hypothetical protein
MSSELKNKHSQASNFFKNKNSSLLEKEADAEEKELNQDLQNSLNKTMREIKKDTKLYNIRNSTKKHTNIFPLHTLDNALENYCFQEHQQLHEGQKGQKDQKDKENKENKEDEENEYNEEDEEEEEGRIHRERIRIKKKDNIELEDSRFGFEDKLNTPTNINAAYNLKNIDAGDFNSEWRYFECRSRSLENTQLKPPRPRCPFISKHKLAQIPSRKIQNNLLINSYDAQRNSNNQNYANKISNSSYNLAQDQLRLQRVRNYGRWYLKPNQFSRKLNL